MWIFSSLLLLLISPSIQITNMVNERSIVFVIRVQLTSQMGSAPSGRIWGPPPPEKKKERIRAESKCDKMRIDKSQKDETTPDETAKGMRAPSPTANMIKTFSESGQTCETKWGKTPVKQGEPRWDHKKLDDTNGLLITNSTSERPVNPYQHAASRLPNHCRCDNWIIRLLWSSHLI